MPKEEEMEKELINYWEGIYQKENSNIKKVWNNDKRTEYERESEEHSEGQRVNHQEGIEIPRI